PQVAHQRPTAAGTGQRIESQARRARMAAPMALHHSAVVTARNRARAEANGIRAHCPMATAASRSPSQVRLLRGGAEAPASRLTELGPVPGMDGTAPWAGR